MPMEPYSKEHTEYLLNNLHHSTRYRVAEEEEFLGKLRAHLRAGDRKAYLECLQASPDNNPCQLCEVLSQSQLCNRCWELRHRIEDVHHIARITATQPGREMLAELQKQLNTLLELWQPSLLLRKKTENRAVATPPAAQEEDEEQSCGDPTCC